MIICENCANWDTEINGYDGTHFCPMQGRNTDAKYYCADAEPRDEKQSNRYEQIQNMSLKAMAEYFQVLAYCNMRGDQYNPCPYLGTNHSCQQCWEDYLAEEVNNGNSSSGK